MHPDEQTTDSNLKNLGESADEYVDRELAVLSEPHGRKAWQLSPHPGDSMVGHARGRIRVYADS